MRTAEYKISTESVQQQKVSRSASHGDTHKLTRIQASRMAVMSETNAGSCTVDCNVDNKSDVLGGRANVALVKPTSEHYVLCPAGRQVCFGVGGEGGGGGRGRGLKYG